MGYTKIWWLEKELKDGNVWKGFFKTYSENNNFPEILDGRYSVSKDVTGYDGMYRVNHQSNLDALANNQYITTAGIWRNEPDESHKPVDFRGIIEYYSNIAEEYDTLLITGNLEDDISIKHSFVYDTKNDIDNKTAKYELMGVHQDE